MCLCLKKKEKWESLSHDMQMSFNIEIRAAVWEELTPEDQ